MTRGGGDISAVIVLAGGENTRMGALQGTIYKAFLPIHGASLIARQTLRASGFGIPRVDVIVDELDPVLHLLAQPGADGAPGTGSPTDGGATDVRLLAHPGSRTEKILWWHRQNPAEPKIMVILGDTLAKVDLVDLWQAPDADEVDTVIAVAKVSIPMGVAQVEEKLVVAFKERQHTEFLVHTGYMVLGELALKYLAGGIPVMQALERLAAEGLLGYRICASPLIRVDTLEDVAAVHDLFSQGPFG